MKTHKLPFVAAIILAWEAMVLPSVLAQGLPPTVFGKFVKQPGDNQYGGASQWGRHHQEIEEAQATAQAAFSTAQSAVASHSSGGKNFTLRRIPRHDITVDPITTDEPIAIAGFPPLPDRLDLPISSGINAMRFLMMRRPMGGLSQSGSADEVNRNPTGVHQHYTHYEPGAFLPPKRSASWSEPAGSQGYYNYGEVAPAAKASGYHKGGEPNQDYYNANPGQGAPLQGGQDVALPGMPRYHGHTVNDVRRLGREPRLSDQGQWAAPPPPPTPMIVNQATTQDLSLPEDEFAYQRPQKPSAAKQAAKNLGQRLLMPLNSLGGYGMGLHF